MFACYCDWRHDRPVLKITSCRFSELKTKKVQPTLIVRASANAALDQRIATRSERNCLVEAGSPTLGEQSDYDST
jgi:hypothetical protein